MVAFGKYIDVHKVDNVDVVFLQDLLSEISPERHIYTYLLEFKKAGKIAYGKGLNSYISVKDAIKSIRYSRITTELKKELEQDLKKQIS